MKKGEMLSTMIMLATEGHFGQFDRGGNPYILHPLKVMHYLKSTDEELQCIAVGHDLIEDTAMTYATLRERGISERVITGIKALTKERGESYDEYREKVKANIDAVQVKMCDLRHNSDIRRLKSNEITEKDIARIVKYQKFFLELKEILEKSQ